MFAPSFLDERVADEKSLVVAAFVAQRLVGIGVAQLIDRFEYYKPFDPNIERELNAKKIGSFSTLSVEEPFQGQGIGQRISEMRLAWLRSRSCDVIVGVSWVSGLAHTSDRVFQRMGFRAVKRVDGFYVAQSREKPFDCPGCKTLPCACAAVMYRLDLTPTA